MDITAQRGCCWADVHGDTAPDVPALRSLLAKHTAEPPRTSVPLPPFDHVFPGTPANTVNTEGAVVVVVYGGLGSDCFEALHREMVDQVNGVEANKEGASGMLIRCSPLCGGLCGVHYVVVYVGSMCGLCGVYVGFK